MANNRHNVGRFGQISRGNIELITDGFVRVSSCDFVDLTTTSHKERSTKLRELTLTKPMAHSGLNRLGSWWTVQIRPTKPISQKSRRFARSWGRSPRSASGSKSSHL